MAADEPRKYDSSRRQSSGRERVLDAALSVARGIGSWNWADITFKAVAEEAGVSERTIYRHFPTQRDLHEAMMIRINKQAAISYDGLNLDDVPTIVDRLFTSMATFTHRSASAPPPPGALVAMDRERILSLLEATGGNKQQAAVLDILWSVEAYERLVVNWRMSTEEAVETALWAVRLLSENRGGTT